jgi:hypothetical protein
MKNRSGLESGTTFKISNEQLAISNFRKATNGSGYNTSRAGAKPHGQKDKVIALNKLFSALHLPNWEPTLSGAD